MARKKGGKQKKRAASVEAPTPAAQATEAAPAIGAAPESGARRYWNRATQGVLLAGALAGAVTAVVGLWPSPDVADEAHLTSVSVLRMPLSEYVRRSSAPAAKSAPAPGHHRIELASFRGSQPSLTVDPRQTFAPVAPAGPTLDPRKQTATITTGSPRLTIAPSIQPTVGPTLVPPSSVQTPVRLGELDKRAVTSKVTDREVIDQLSAQSPHFSTQLCDGSVADECVAYLVHGSQVDESGKPVDAKSAAKQIIEVLGQARTSSGGEVLGVQVSTSLEVIGLRGRDLQLSWSLLQKDGATALPPSWQHSTMSYVLNPSTDHDSGAVDLWVPLPRAKGTYLVQLTLRVGDSVLTSATSPEFG